MSISIGTTIQILLALASGGGVSWLAMWVVPRTRRNREKAEANTAAFQSIDIRIASYERSMVSMMGRIKSLEQQCASQDRKIEQLDRYIEALLNHVNDLYRAIGLEDEMVQKRIKGRLRTQRPSEPKEIIGGD
ncbi:MAG: hypothetical protein IVW55_18295 [Chloroflexi bacterium]|nr:hypothetical protein [Chloroflexota bacterium]